MHKVASSGDERGASSLGLWASKECSSAWAKVDEKSSNDVGSRWAAKGKNLSKSEKLDGNGETRKAGERCSAELEKQDSIRTTAESGERRALSRRCDFSSLSTSLVSAAAAFQFLRVFSAISAPFDLNASDSCSNAASNRRCGAVGLVSVSQPREREWVAAAASAAGLLSTYAAAVRTVELPATRRHQHALTSTSRRPTKMHQGRGSEQSSNGRRPPSLADC